MNCKHALALIDAMSLGELRPSQLEAVERHARDCDQCRPALATAKALDLELCRLPEPSPPAALAAAVLARATCHGESPAPEVCEPSLALPASAKDDRRAWVMLLAGILMGLGAQAYRLLVGESMLPLASPLLRSGLQGFIEMQAVSPAVLVLAVGLLLYVAGLFASLRDRVLV